MNGSAYHGLILGLGVVLAPLVVPQSVFAVAGVRVIGTYSGTPHGMAFDGDPNPLMIDFSTSVLRRIDLNTGNVLSTTPMDHNGFSSLTWDPATQTLFSTDQSRTVYKVDRATGVSTRLPQSMPNFNFWDIEWDSAASRLWCVTDINHGEIYTVNTTTGAATLQKNFGVFAGNGGGIQSMALGGGAGGGGGEIIIAGEQDPNSGPDLWRIDPLSGSVSLAADLPFPHFGPLLLDLDYNPATNRWFAVEEDRSASPRSYSLIELTNVPEPATLNPATVITLAAVLRRRARA